MYPFNEWYVFYRHIEDVLEEVNVEITIFDKFGLVSIRGFSWDLNILIIF